MSVFDDYELSLPLHEYSVCTSARWTDFGWLFLRHFLLVSEVHHRVDLCQWYSCHQILSAVYLACYLWFDDGVLDFSSSGKHLACCSFSVSPLFYYPQNTLFLRGISPDYYNISVPIGLIRYVNVFPGISIAYHLLIVCVWSARNYFLAWLVHVLRCMQFYNFVVHQVRVLLVWSSVIIVHRSLRGSLLLSLIVLTSLLVNYLAILPSFCRPILYGPIFSPMYIFHPLFYLGGGSVAYIARLSYQPIQ